MAINDTRIDLTEGNKFSEGRRFNLFDHVNSGSFPWNTRQLTSDTLMVETRWVRPWGDTISDEMGYVVRRGSDNKWWFGDYTDHKKPYFWNMFESVMYEIGMVKPLDCICTRCGEKQITTNRFYDVCDKCKVEMACEETMKKLFPKKEKTTFISWLGSTERIAFDKKLNRHVVGFEIPNKVLQELI